MSSGAEGGGGRARWSTSRARCGARASTGCRRARGSRPRSAARAARPGRPTSARSTSPRRSRTAARSSCPRRAPGGGVAAGVAPEPAEGQPLNLNTATLEQLDTLSGVGPATAQKILDAREEGGGFGSIEELGEIPGIGDARLATLREEATV